MFRSLVAASLMALPIAALAQTAVPPPKLAPAEAIQLFDAAGFKFVDRHLENRCGHAVNPRVAFTDLNGDGRPEAHVADVDPRCYAKPGAYYAIMARNDAGHWGRMIAEDAIVSFDTTRTDGWADIEVKPGNGPCPGQRHYQSYSYAIPCMVGDAPRQAAATVAASAPGDGDPTDGWTLPMAFADIPAGTRDVLLRQAGFHGTGTAWKGCDGLSEVSFNDSLVKDLNGDGRPEVVVMDHGTGCYGMTGIGFTIFAATPGGWKLMEQSAGIPRFLPGKGADGFPDIEIGGPGFCFPIARWDGRRYAIVGHAYEGKACTPP